MTVDRMKKRHGNINNEILMEKRVSTVFSAVLHFRSLLIMMLTMQALNRLDHPGIVQLYNTFQDYGTLYYQMEFVAGRDLWDRLHDVQLVSGLAVGGAGGGLRKPALARKRARRGRCTRRWAVTGVWRASTWPRLSTLSSTCTGTVLHDLPCGALPLPSVHTGFEVAYLL
jgi:hypothetical protein